MDILQHTPSWVFFLFAALVALGFWQSRPRVSPRRTVAVFPLAMVVWSFTGVLSAFGASAKGIAGWMLGLGLAVLLNQWIASARDVRYAPQTRSFHIPGSWLPLALMMAIFCVKFAVGVTAAREPVLVGSASFIALVSTLYGFLSGLFFARLLQVLRAASPRLAASR